MAKYLNYKSVSIEQIVEELFDLSKLGAFSIPNFITIKAREELSNIINLSRYLFKKAERERGSVIQEVETLYFEITNKNLIPKYLKECADKLSIEYSEFYNKIAEKANFVKTFNSIGFHIYYKGSIGITPHQDFKADTNLISSFVIQGNAPFYVCSNRNKENSKQLETYPGTLILMRAARNEEEQNERPFHYLLGPMKEDRYSILLRNRKSKENINY